VDAEKTGHAWIVVLGKSYQLAGEAEVMLRYVSEGKLYRKRWFAPIQDVSRIICNECEYEPAIARRSPYCARPRLIIYRCQFVKILPVDACFANRDLLISRRVLVSQLIGRRLTNADKRYVWL